MAVQDQSQNQLREIGGVIRRRAAQIALPAVVLLALGYAMSTLVPRKYTAQTGLEVRETTTPIRGQGVDEKTIQRDVSNTTWQITQFERVWRVIKTLEWPEYTALKPAEQYEFVRDTIANIQVWVSPPSANLQGSRLIQIKYSDTEPGRAEQFLNRLRDTFTREVLERYRNDARKALEVLKNEKDRAAALAKQRDEEAAKLKKDSGVSATQQAPGGGRQRDEDPVFTRWSQAQLKYDQTQFQLASAVAALGLLQKQFREAPPEVPELLTYGGVPLEQELALIEKEIADQEELQKGLRPLNSIYMRAEYRIAQLREKEAALKERATAPTSQTTMRPNPLREQLAAKVQQKEIEIEEARGLLAQLELDLKQLRTQQAERVEVFSRIQELDREAAIAAKNYEDATNAYNTQLRVVDLITDAYSNPFEVTELARAPKTPSSPSDAIVIAAGLVLGLGLGLLWALIDEYGRNGFRGVSDATRSLAVPALGIVNQIRTRRERQSRRARGAVVGASTLALAAAIAWVSWSYEHRPEVLGPDLVRALDGARKALR
jgi:capsular polysaccharide biosynthesis protein